MSRWMVALELAGASASTDLYFVRKGGVIGGGSRSVRRWPLFQEHFQQQRSAIDFVHWQHMRTGARRHSVHQNCLLHSTGWPFTSNGGASWKVMHHIQKVPEYIQKWQRPYPVPSEYPNPTPNALKYSRVGALVGGFLRPQISLSIVMESFHAASLVPVVGGPA